MGLGIFYVYVFKYNRKLINSTFKWYNQALMTEKYLIYILLLILVLYKNNKLLMLPSNEKKLNIVLLRIS